MSAIRERIFGQVTPDGSVTAVTLVAATANVTKIVKNIFVKNAGAAATFGIYHAPSATSATVAKSLYHKHSITASTTLQLVTYVPVEGTAGSMIVQSSSPNNITFTAYGADIIESPFNK